MARGVLATGNSLRVALFTPTSVACADSSTAAINSNGVVYSSSVSGVGLAACNVAKKSAMSAFFMRSECLYETGATGLHAVENRLRHLRWKRCRQLRFDARQHAW